MTSTPGSSYQEDLDYLTDYAREDWVGLSPIAAVAGQANSSRVTGSTG